MSDDPLLDAADAIIRALDEIAGDPDLEDGHDREPDLYHMCNWQDEGDQTRLRYIWG